MGKSSVNGPFSIAMLNNQRVDDLPSGNLRVCELETMAQECQCRNLPKMVIVHSYVVP